MIDVDDFLEHFGVKGMQWGQRRDARQRAKIANSPGTRKAAKDWANSPENKHHFDKIHNDPRYRKDGRHSDRLEIGYLTRLDNTENRLIQEHTNQIVNDRMNTIARVRSDNRTHLGRAAITTGALAAITGVSMLYIHRVAPNGF